MSDDPRLSDERLLHLLVMALYDQSPGTMITVTRLEDGIKVLAVSSGKDPTDLMRPLSLLRNEMVRLYGVVKSERVCSRCGSPRRWYPDDGNWCTDETCPLSEWPESVRFDSEGVLVHSSDVWLRRKRKNE